MKGERRLALTRYSEKGRKIDVTGGKDIPYAAQRRLLKFGFPHVFLLFFYRTPRHLCDGGYRLLCFPILFSAMADWRRCVATSSTMLSFLFIDVSSRSHIHPIISSNQSIHPIHPSINDPFNNRTRPFGFLYFLPVVFYPFSFFLAPIYYLRCTVRATGNRVLLASARL